MYKGGSYGCALLTNSGQYVVHNSRYSVGVSQGADDRHVAQLAPGGVHGALGAHDALQVLHRARQGTQTLPTLRNLTIYI